MRKWLIEMRKGAGYTRHKTAHLLGMTHREYVDIEENRRDIGFINAFRIARLFNVTIDKMVEMERAI